MPPTSHAHSHTARRHPARDGGGGLRRWSPADDGEALLSAAASGDCRPSVSRVRGTRAKTADRLDAFPTPRLVLRVCTPKRRLDKNWTKTGLNNSETRLSD